MRIRERYELAEELRARYRGAGRVEKGPLLDSFCLASGYGRKYAVKVLRGRRRLPVSAAVPGERGGEPADPVGRPARRWLFQLFNASRALMNPGATGTPHPVVGSYPEVVA